MLFVLVPSSAEDFGVNVQTTERLREQCLVPGILLRVPVGGQNCDVRSATEFTCC